MDYLIGLSTARVVPVLLGLLLAVNLWGCSSPAPVQPTPTPRELTAGEILQKTAEQMRTVNSLHFNMEMTGGTMMLGPGITVSKVDGDAARPDKVSLKTKATFGGFLVDVEMLSVAGKQYLRNPLTKSWQGLAGDVSATNLLDPEKGALTILAQARDLKRVPNEELEGTKVFHIVGTVPASAITAVAGGTPSGSDVTIDAWIGIDDFVLRKVLVSGSVLDGESTQVVRTIGFSQFNQPVRIEAPQ